MKVVLINAVYGFKSTGVITKNLYDYLSNDGHDAYAVFQQASLVPKNGYQLGNLLDWKWHALYTRLTGKQGYASSIPTKSLISYLEIVKPDIVHLHNLHSNYINVNLLLDYLKEKKIATVITLHDCWFFTGKCTHFIQYDCEKWKQDCGHCPQLMNEVPSLFVDNTSFVLKDKCAHLNALPNVTIVGCSEWISKLAIQSHIGKNRVMTIHNGINTNIFRARESKFATDHALKDKFVIIGFAEKWSDQKNIEGVKAILSSFDENDRLVLVGCNEKTPSIFGDDKQVIKLPYITEQIEMADVYNAADVFVNLTRFENYPTVNLESVCCGTPVITFDVGGCAETVDNDDGIVVPEGDFDAVIKAINRLKKSSLQYDVSEKCAKHDKSTFCKKYLNLYSEVTSL